jgi:hypothetical protein
MVLHRPIETTRVTGHVPYHYLLLQNTIYRNLRGQNCRSHGAAGLHVASRGPTAHAERRYGFATIDLCRSAIAQAAPSGGSRRESLRSPFLRITDSTATTELPL